MNRLAKLLGTVLVLPVAATLLLGAAAPSLADDGECDSVLFGLVMDCSNKGKDEPKPTDSPKVTPTPTRTAKTPVAPSPVSPPKTTSAPVTTPEKPVTPAPQPTVTVVEKTKEVIITTEVTVTPSTTPSPLPPLGPTQTKTTKPTTSSSAAVAPAPTSAPPADQLSIDQQANSGDFIPKSVGDAGPLLFFIGLAGITTMLIIARVKRYFPFEKGTHRS